MRPMQVYTQISRESWGSHSPATPRRVCPILSTAWDSAAWHTADTDT